MNEAFHKSRRIAGPPQRSVAPPVPGLIEAWVSAGGVDTRYWRAGIGPCVLVLLDPVTLVEIVTWQSLATLARTHRVLIAETTDAITGAVSAGPTRVSSWLRGLIEGLGVAPVGFIASTTVEATLREYLSGRSEAPACVLWLQLNAPEEALATTLETPESVLSNMPLHVGVERFSCWLRDRTDPPGC
jgi:hypothetical protein